jgi:hypothetical protein
MKKPATKPETNPKQSGGRRGDLELAVAEQRVNQLRELYASGNEQFSVDQSNWNIVEAMKGKA